MTARRGGLGRGLGALIPPAPPQPAATGNAVAPVVFAELAVEDIRPNPRQPRVEFDEGALTELVASLREVGVLQPVVVRQVERPDAEPYELVMGERRWRAARRAGFAQIPAIIRATPDDAMLRDALLENLHRAELNPLEEAAAYQQLLQEFGLTHEVLANRIGRSRSQVTNTIRLLNLPAPVQRRVAAGVLSAGHARALLALPDNDAVEAMALRIVAENLSVRAVEELVALTARSAGKSPRVRTRTPSRYDPVAAEFGARLAEYLDTSVRIELGRAKSRLVIDIADMDDLARITGMISGPAPSQEALENIS